MPTLSIKDVPEPVAQALRERARLNHRSLQGELLSLVTAAAAAHDVVVPAPGLRVDGLAHAAQHAQRAQVVLLHGRVAEAHERADGRGRRVELRHLEALDDLPVAARVRVERRALEHERRDAVAERPVHHPRVPCDPAVKGEEREE